MGPKRDAIIWNVFLDREKNTGDLYGRKQRYLYFEASSNKCTKIVKGWVNKTRKTHVEEEFLQKITIKQGHIRIYAVKSPCSACINKILHFLKENPKITLELYFAAFSILNITRPDLWEMPSIKTLSAKLKALSDHARVKQMNVFGKKEWRFMANLLGQTFLYTEKNRNTIWDFETFENEEYTEVWKAIKNDEFNKLGDKIILLKSHMTSKQARKQFPYQMNIAFKSRRKSPSRFGDYVYYEFQKKKAPKRCGWIGGQFSKYIKPCNVLLKLMTGKSGHLKIYLIRSPNKQNIQKLEKFLEKNKNITMEIYFAYVHKLKLTDPSDWKTFRNIPAFETLLGNKQIKEFRPFNRREWGIICKKMKWNPTKMVAELDYCREADENFAVPFRGKGKAVQVAPYVNAASSFEFCSDYIIMRIFKRDPDLEHYCIYFEFTDENNEVTSGLHKDLKFVHSEESLLKKLKHLKKGNLRLYCTHSPCLQCTHKIIGFLKRHPDIKMELYFTNITYFNIWDITSWHYQPVKDSFQAIQILSEHENVTEIRLFNLPEWEIISKALNDNYQHIEKPVENLWDMKTMTDAEYADVFKAFRENKVDDLISRIAFKWTIMTRKDIEENKNNIWNSFFHSNALYYSYYRLPIYYIYYEFDYLNGAVEVGWATNYKDQHAEMAVLSLFAKRKGILTFYSVMTPCYIGCVDKILKFLEDHPNIKLNIYFCMLSNFEMQNPLTWGTPTSVQTCKKARQLRSNVNVLNMEIFKQEHFELVSNKLEIDPWSIEIGKATMKNEKFREIWDAIKENQLDKYEEAQKKLAAS